MQCHTLVLNKDRISKIDSVVIDPYIWLIPIYYSLNIFPFAIIHQSTLFGYILYFFVFLRLNMAMNFRRNFCNSCLGFSISAFIVCAVYVCIKLAGVDEKFTEPFASSVETLNRNILYFGVLADVAICGYRDSNPLMHLLYLSILGAGFYYEINF